MNGTLTFISFSKALPTTRTNNMANYNFGNTPTMINQLSDKCLLKLASKVGNLMPINGWRAICAGLNLEAYDFQIPYNLSQWDQSEQFFKRLVGQGITIAALKSALISCSLTAYVDIINDDIELQAKSSANWGAAPVFEPARSIKVTLHPLIANGELRALIKGDTFKSCFELPRGKPLLCRMLNPEHAAKMSIHQMEAQDIQILYLAYKSSTFTFEDIRKSVEGSGVQYFSPSVEELYILQMIQAVLS